jgi:hypothetical protein
MKTLHTFKLIETGELFTVELDIAEHEVARALAARAVKSKHGKAQSLNGDIKCKVIERVTP